MTIERLCQRPGCDDRGTDTYTGKHDNEILLCENHYYKLVTGDSPSNNVSHTRPTQTIWCNDRNVGTGNTIDLSWREGLVD